MSDKPISQSAPTAVAHGIDPATLIWPVWPQPDDASRDGGWLIDPGFLRSIVSDLEDFYDERATMEQIECVLRAVSQRMPQVPSTAPSAVPDRMTSPAAEHLANQLDQEADEITCYASTIKEYRPNKSAALLREASKVIRLNVLYPDRTQIGWQCTEASGARHFIWKAEDEDAELAWIKKRYISWVPAFIAIAPTERQR